MDNLLLGITRYIMYSYQAPGFYVYNCRVFLGNLGESVRLLNNCRA